MDKQTIRREFDNLAPVYESNRLAPWYRAHAHAVLAAMTKPVIGDVLDIGCGSGYLLRQITGSWDGLRALGLDLSQRMVVEARRQTDGDNPDFREADFETVAPSSLSDYRFRTILCINTLHYFADPRTALCRMGRLLPEGGDIYVLERDKTGSLLTRFWGLLHRYVIRNHVRFHGKNEIIANCREAGFDLVEEVFTIRRFFWHRKTYTSIVLIHCRKEPDDQPDPV